MSNKENVSIVSRSLKETRGGQDKGVLLVGHDVFAAEICTAKCRTCQQTCDYPGGHQGLHHCSNGHEWI